MIEFKWFVLANSICSIICYVLGYKIATLNFEEIVKREVERQIHKLSEWTMKDED
jgi:hypothetical protein